MEKSPSQKKARKIQKVSLPQKIVQKVQKQKVSLHLQILRVEQVNQRSLRAMKALLLIQNHPRHRAVKKKTSLFQMSAMNVKL